MKYIDTSHAVDGKFKDQDTATNFPGTEINASYMNTLQDELCNVIIDSDIKLDETKNNQLSESINKRISASATTISKEVTQTVSNAIDSVKVDINKATDIKIEAAAQDINADVLESLDSTLATSVQAKVDAELIKQLAAIKSKTVLTDPGSDPRVEFDHTTKTFTFYLASSGTPLVPKPDPEPIPGLQLKTINKRGLVVGFGDSYVDGTSSEQLPNALDLAIALGSNDYPAYSSHGLLSGYMETGTNNFEVLDAGIYGTKASESTNRVAVVKAINPDVVVLRFGTNELGGGNSGRADTPAVFKTSMNSIVKQFSPIPVVIVPQNKLKDYDDSLVKALNDVITEVVAQNSNAVTFQFEAYKDGDWDMFMPDNTHPNSLGYMLMGQDIRKSVDAVINSTWKYTNVLSSLLTSKYIPVAASNGSLGDQPLGWWADGPAEHTKDGEFHKVSYTGGKGGAEAKLNSAEFTNSTDLPVKLVGTVTLKASNVVGFNTDNDWNISDKVILMVQCSGNDWNLNFSFGVASISKVGDVPLITLTTKPIVVQPSKSVIMSLTVKGGSAGGKPVAWFKDAELFIVE